MEPIKTDDGSYTLKDSYTQEMYHSRSGALLESQSLYIDKSSIKNSFTDNNGTVAVLDVGLGLGYNVCATIDAWLEEESVASLRVLSLEKNFDLVAQLTMGKAVWQDGWHENWILWCQSLKRVSSNLLRTEIFHPKSNRICIWEIFIGDAYSFNWLFLFRYKWDFIWQDPFSPKCGGELWSTKWFSFLSHQSSKECTLMTYSVSRQTKDVLDKGGWSWKKIPAFGQKRSWLKARPKKESSTVNTI